MNRRSWGKWIAKVGVTVFSLVLSGIGMAVTKYKIILGFPLVMLGMAVASFAGWLWGWRWKREILIIGPVVELISISVLAICVSADHLEGWVFWGFLLLFVITLLGGRHRVPS